MQAERTKRDPRTYDIFPGWDADVQYVNGDLTRNKARHVACKEEGGWYRGTVARRVWMRDCEPDDALDFTEGESEAFFVECVKTHPDAVPMWKVTVAG